MALLEDYVEQLESSDFFRRADAAHKLLQLNDKNAVPALIKTLEIESQEPLTREKVWVLERVITALGYLQDKRATEPLLKLVNSENGQLRSKVTQALSDLNNPRVIQPFMDLLLNGLEETVDENTLIIHGDPGQQVAYTIGKLGDETLIQPLLTLFQEGSLKKRQYACSALYHLTDRLSLESEQQNEIFKHALTGLQDDDTDIRSSCVLIVGKIGGEKAFDLLKPLLKDDSFTVRFGTAMALSYTSDPRIVAEISSLLNDKEEDVRLLAVEILGDSGNEQAIKPLLNLLVDKSDDVRYTAVVGHGNCGTEGVLAELEQIRLHDKGSNSYSLELISDVATTAIEKIKQRIKEQYQA